MPALLYQPHHHQTSDGLTLPTGGLCYEGGYMQYQEKSNIWPNIGVDQLLLVHLEVTSKYFILTEI